MGRPGWMDLDAYNGMLLRVSLSCVRYSKMRGRQFLQLLP